MLKLKVQGKYLNLPDDIQINLTIDIKHLFLQTVNSYTDNNESEKKQISDADSLCKYFS